MGANSISKPLPPNFGVTKHSLSVSEDLSFVPLVDCNKVKEHNVLPRVGNQAEEIFVMTVSFH